MADLIRFDKNHNLDFEGYCNLSINRVSNILVIVPENEEYKMISASFKWKYFAIKNLLFVIADFNFLDFCLVFKNESICQKVYQLSTENKTQESSEPDAIETHFLIPIFEKIQKNPPANSALMQIIADWISLLADDDVKGRCVTLMQQYEIYEFLLALIKSNNVENATTKDAVNSQRITKRKRKFPEISGKKKRLEIISAEYTKIILKPHFKIIRSQKRSQRKLLIYTSTNSSTFHEYNWDKHNAIFVCANSECQNPVLLDFTQNDEICVKLTDDPHKCELLNSIEGHFEMQEMKKPKYVIHDNPNIKVTRAKKRLFIFDDSNYGHKYYFYGRTFTCVGCKKINHHRSQAYIFNEGEENEYVEYEKGNHVCQKIKYNFKEFEQCYEVVLEPNFEIHYSYKNGIERKTLVIFGHENRSVCYTYNYTVERDYFRCNGCGLAGKTIKAKLKKNYENVEYVILCNSKHVCEPRPYTPPSNFITLRPPEFEILEETKTGIPKLFIFDKSDRSKCHIFRPPHALASKFYCMGCSKPPNGKYLIGYLHKNEKGESSFKMKENQEHVCQLQKYEPKRFEAIPKTFDIIFYRPKSSPNSLKAAVCHPENRKLCYTFAYSKRLKSPNMFLCCQCKAKNKSRQITLLKDERNGKEYFMHDFKKHICKPLKVSSIMGPKFLRLESSGLNLNISRKKFDQDKIVKMPLFELRPNKFGVPERKIFIFLSKERKQYHVFNYNTHNVKFFCPKCKAKNHYVGASLKTDKNQEKFIVMTKNEHICEPLNFEEPKLVESPNFEIQILDDEKKSKKLIIFTSESREFCYEYSEFRPCYFQCRGCFCLSKTISAKLLKNQGGTEYVELSKTDHICVPRKFVKSFPKKFIPASMFELYPNKTGDVDKRLIVFASQEKAKYYSFELQRGAGNFYKCGKCSRLNVTVAAKLMENSENSEKYLELDGIEHVCEPQKFKFSDELSRKLEFQKIPNFEIPDSMFLLLQNEKGDPDKKLLIFTSDEKKFCYKFQWRRIGYYTCRACNEKKFPVSAKLMEKENGKKCLEMNGNQHICEPEEFIASKELDQKIEIRHYDHIQNSMFEFRPNNKGEKDRKILVFTSQKKDKNWVFWWLKKNYFLCWKCKYHKKSVSVNLLEKENGEKYLETNGVQHVCKPDKYKPQAKAAKK